MSLPRCLIIDPDPQSAEVLSGIIGRHGFEVHHIPDPFLALRDLRSSLYDLVVFDLSTKESDAGFVLGIVQREMPQVIERTVIVTTNPLVASDVAAGVPVVGKSDLRPLMDYLTRA